MQIDFEQLIKQRNITLFMPTFNQFVKFRIEARGVFDKEKPCIRLHGRVGKKIIVSEYIFSQKDIDEMTHIFQPAK